MSNDMTTSSEHNPSSEQKEIVRQHNKLTEEKEALQFERQLWRSMFGTVKALRRFYQFDPSAKSERKMIRETMLVVAPRLATLECEIDAISMELFTIEFELTETALVLIRDIESGEGYE